MCCSCPLPVAQSTVQVQAWAGMSLNIWAGLSCSILLRTEQRSASQITQSKHCHDCHVTVVVRHVHML